MKSFRYCRYALPKEAAQANKREYEVLMGFFILVMLSFFIPAIVLLSR
jgi:hypothetical protein